jgi:hypothetical protein
MNVEKLKEYLDDLLESRLEQQADFDYDEQIYEERRPLNEISEKEFQEILKIINGLTEKGVQNMELKQPIINQSILLIEEEEAYYIYFKKDNTSNNDIELSNNDVSALCSIFSIKYNDWNLYDNCLRIEKY